MKLYKNTCRKVIIAKRCHRITGLGMDSTWHV